MSKKGPLDRPNASVWNETPTVCGNCQMRELNRHGTTAPASRPDLGHVRPRTQRAIEHARPRLQFSAGKRVHNDSFMAKIVAERPVEHLERYGFVDHEEAAAQR